MTSTTDTAGHPDVAELSDFGEGLLPPSRSTVVRRHLGTCALCSDVYASLEEIRDLLGTLPGPSRMPADVAGRIDAALAAEALLASTAGAGHSASGPVAAPDGGVHEASQEAPLDTGHAAEAATVTEAAGAAAPEETDRNAEPPGPPVADGPAAASSPSSATRSLSGPPAAARAGVAGSGAPSPHGAGHVSRETPAPPDRPAGRPRATTGPGRTVTRSSRRRVALLGTALTAAVAVGVGSLLVSSWRGDSPAGSPERGERAAMADTFAAGTLERTVDGLLGTEESASSGSRTPRLGVENAAPQDDPQVLRGMAVPACVRQGLGRTEPALATEEGVYSGRPVWLVVLPDPTDNSRVTAYVVSAECVAQDSADKAEVLLKDTYPRP